MVCSLSGSPPNSENRIIGTPPNLQQQGLFIQGWHNQHFAFPDIELGFVNVIYIIERHINIGDSISNRDIPNFGDIMSNFGDKYWGYWKWCLKSIKILYSMKNRTFTKYFFYYIPKIKKKYQYYQYQYPKYLSPKLQLKYQNGTFTLW